IAITGADLSAQLDGRPIPMWKCILAQKGSELSFGKAREGCRTYLTVHGGIDVPEVMGSRSTYIKAGIGGLEGRSLKAKDILSVKP
ncbi:biotin-dependent carboxyltransferase family protein, partial [Microbacteriaceae bacterium K1510]|nr:biotin-dependent carboxyltransferase family protein [Microbacteriaceae bacterium K1510]